MEDTITHPECQVRAKSSQQFAPEKLLDSAEWPGSAIFHCARQLIGQTGLTRSDLDDLRQDLAIHAFRQWPKFDSHRASERTFLDRILRQRQRAILRRRRSKGRSELTVPITAETLRDRRRTVLRSHVAEVDRRIDVSHTLKKLSFTQRTLARGLMTDTLSELARRRAQHRQRLYESLRCIRTEFERSGMRDHLP